MFDEILNKENPNAELWRQLHVDYLNLVEAIKEIEKPVDPNILPSELIKLLKS